MNPESASLHLHCSESRPEHDNIDGKDIPMALIRLQIDLRESCDYPTEEDTETSIAIQSLLLNDEENSSGTISALWNMPENIRFVQNLMASILNSLESFKNIFNWTVPSKTYYIYWLFVLLWLVSIAVPGRYLILIVGIYDFFYCFMPQPDDFPFDTRLNNLLEALPNDDELELVYESERNMHIKKVTEKHRSRLKRAKLSLTFECLWDGKVRLRDNIGVVSTRGKSDTWEVMYMVVQGHRLVWWRSDSDVDAGKAPVGQLLLQGHAGVSHASPMDIKELGDNGRLLTVFGKDVSGIQKKVTVLCDSSSSCQSLSVAVIGALDG